MATVTYHGTGQVLTSDFKTVSWEGLTKSGKAVTITLTNAVSNGNIDWTFAEKDDVVPARPRIPTPTPTSATRPNRGVSKSRTA